jgi:hypothetical protein
MRNSRMYLQLKIYFGFYGVTFILNKIFISDKNIYSIKLFILSELSHILFILTNAARCFVRLIFRWPKRLYYNLAMDFLS